MGAGPHTPLLGKREKQALPGTHALCEHVLTGKRIAGDACGTDRFRVPVIRVCPPQEPHVLCEHALTGEVTSSGVCCSERLHRSSIGCKKRALLLSLEVVCF